LQLFTVFNDFFFDALIPACIPDQSGLSAKYFCVYWMLYAVIQNHCDGCNIVTAVVSADDFYFIQYKYEMENKKQVVCRTTIVHFLTVIIHSKKQNVHKIYLLFFLNRQNIF
jgi:hypothetical protein